MNSINDFFNSLENNTNNKKYEDIDAPKVKDKLNNLPDNLSDKILSLKSKISRKKQNIQSFAEENETLPIIKQIPLNSDDFNLFSDLIFLDKTILKNLLSASIQLPTPTQKRAIPLMCSGSDVVITAPTGSGKTLAYLLPSFCHLKFNNFNTKILIISPTRELSLQIFEKCREIAPKIDSAILVGGIDIKNQLSALKKGPKIVVGSPGRIVDIASKKRLNLCDFSLIILDEADRLFDAGFAEQLNLIFSAIRKDAQIAAFSATFPDFLEEFLGNFRQNFKRIDIFSAEKLAPNLQQKIEIFDSNSEKFEFLLDFLQKNENDQILIFCENNSICDFLSLKLNDLGLDSRSLHAAQDQIDRIATIRGFKNNEHRILISTSLAARGLDVATLRFVVQFDPPSHREDMIHRAGRCGRGGRPGIVVTLITEETLIYLPMISELLNDSGIDLSPKITAKVLLAKEKLASSSANQLSDGFANTKGFKFDIKEALNAAVKSGKLEDLALIDKDPHIFRINNLPIQVRNIVTKSDFLSQIALKHDILIEIKGNYIAKNTKSDQTPLFISLKGPKNECLAAKTDIQKEINSNLSKDSQIQQIL